jgi:hypothetical protein
MRGLVLVFGLLLAFVSGVQSLLVFYGTDNSDGAVGVLSAFLWFIGASIVFPFPRGAGFLLCAGTLFGILAATSFADMWIWSAIAAALAVLAFVAHRRIRAERLAQENERRRQVERDVRMETLMRMQVEQNRRERGAT